MTDDSRTTAADILRTCFGIDPAKEEPPCPLPVSYTHLTLPTT